MPRRAQRPRRHGCDCRHHDDACDVCPATFTLTHRKRESANRKSLFHNMVFNHAHMKRRGRLAGMGVRLLNSRYALPGLFVGVVLCGVLTVRALACHCVRHTDGRAVYGMHTQTHTQTHTGAQPCFVYSAPSPDLRRMPVRC